MLTAAAPIMPRLCHARLKVMLTLLPLSMPQPPLVLRRPIGRSRPQCLLRPVVAAGVMRRLQTLGRGAVGMLEGCMLRKR